MDGREYNVEIKVEPIGKNGNENMSYNQRVINDSRSSHLKYITDYNRLMGLDILSNYRQIEVKQEADLSYENSLYINNLQQATKNPIDSNGNVGTSYQQEVTKECSHHQMAEYKRLMGLDMLSDYKRIEVKQETNLSDENTMEQLQQAIQIEIVRDDDDDEDVMSDSNSYVSCSSESCCSDQYMINSKRMNGDNEINTEYLFFQQMADNFKALNSGCFLSEDKHADDSEYTVKHYTDSEVKHFNESVHSVEQTSIEHVNSQPVKHSDDQGSEVDTDSGAPFSFVSGSNTIHKSRKCSKVKYNSAGEKRHDNQDVNVLGKLKIKVYRCHVCEYYFTNYLKYKKHFWNHGACCQCEICSRQKPSEIETDGSQTTDRHVPREIESARIIHTNIKEGGK